MIDKNSFRSSCIKQLKYANNIGRYKKDKQIVKRLYEIIKQNNANNVLLYIPMDIEVNIGPLITQLRKERKNVYVPYMEGKSFTMVRYRLPLQKKRFGIKEPKYSRQMRKKQIDIIAVPIIGMDSTYRRIGFGRGMYDRFFEREADNIKKIIFVARKMCYTHHVLTDHYDIPADMIITA